MHRPPLPLTLRAPLHSIVLLAAALGAGGTLAQDASGVCRVAPVAADNPTINTTAPFGDAAQSGATWSAPMTLQQALATPACSKIHLRQGVYKPVVPANRAAVTTAERQTSFAITHPLQLLGGFTGNAGAPGERVLQARNTVLSGDIGGDDSGTNASGGITEGLGKVSWNYNNSHHVVTIGGLSSSASVGGPYEADDSQASYTLIEGLTITGGFAQNSGGGGHPDYSGGGLFCNAVGTGSACSPRIRHAYFTGNAAWRGGAMYTQAGSGGTSSPVISHTTFYGNEAVTGGNGGGIYSSVTRGGTASAEISHSTFFENRAGFGGAIYGTAYSYIFDPGAAPVLSPRIVHSTFTKNAAPTGTGGALYLSTGTYDGNTGNPPPAPVSAPSIVASILWGNTAHASSPNEQQYFRGSGVSLSVANSTVQPASGTFGNPLLGPLQDNGGPTPSVLLGTGSPAFDAVACDASGTTVADDQRGIARPQGVRCDRGSVEIGPQASAPLGLAATTRNGAVDLTWQPPHSQGLSAVTGYTVTATLNGTPVGSCTAVAPATACTITGLTNGTAYQLTVTATNGAGASTPSAPLSATPEFRATDPCAGTTVLHVAPTAAGLADGSSWANAATLQAALARAHAADRGLCQEIRIQQGVYKPTDTADRSISFAIGRPLRLLGGYTGNASVPNERVLNARNTVLSGDIDNNDLGAAANGGITAVARFNTNGTEATENQLKGGNSQHVVSIGGVTGVTAEGGPYTFDESLASYTLIEGLTITGGLATGAARGEFNSGGGLYCNARGPGSICSPAIRHVHFSGNAATSSGGALYNAGYLPLGGGMVGGTSSPDIRYATFSGNGANRGGALYNVGYYGTSSPTIRHTTFSDNAAQYGGAIANNGNTTASPATASPDIRHSTFSGNQAWRGEAIYSEKGDQGTSNPTIAASILWGNGAGPQIYNGASTTTTVTDSIVQNATVWPGAGNRNTDPLLSVLQDNGGPTPTRLPGQGGAAIDAVACGTDATDDQRGVARPQGSGATPCDLGAVEYQSALAQHALTVGISNGAGAGGSVNAQGVAFTTHYEAGRTATLIAMPDASSHFDGWGGDCSGTGACTVTMSQPRSVTASFSLVSFPITLQVTNPAGGNVAGCAASASQASTYTCTPTVNVGYSVSFTGCTSVSGNTCSISNVQGPATLSVTFAPAVYALEATVTGLSGGQKATIRNNGTAVDQPVDNGEIARGGLAHGSAYNLTATAPQHTCTPPANGRASGTATADVTGIVFTCGPPQYTISVTVSGLSGGASLTLANGSESLSLSANGSYPLFNTVSHGGTYNLVVVAQPAGHVCTVTNGSGTATANVSNIAVICTAAPYTVSGTVTGLVGAAQVTLSDNGAGSQTLGNGAFSFATRHASPYAITATNPSGHTCTVTGGTGTAMGNVTGVQVACTASTYAITGAAQPAIGGSVACPAAPVAYGSSAQCTATANAGWRFKAFDAASGCTSVNGTTCDINPVQAARTVTAQFEAYFTGTTVPQAGGTPGAAHASFTGGGPTCRFDNANTAFVAAPATLPAGRSMPHGMLQFKLVGCNTTPVTVSIAWPGAVQGLTKWGKATSTATASTHFTPTGLQVSGNTTTFTVQDGQLGDDDWTVNGEIIDPVGALLAPGGTQAIPTLGEWGLALLSLLAAALGMRTLRRRGGLPA